MKSFFIPFLDFIGEALGHPKVKRAALAAGGFIALDLLVLAGLWAPAARIHSGLRSDIDRYHQAQEDASRAKQTSALYADLEKRVKVLNAQWRNRANQSDLIGLLGNLASRNQLKIVSQDFEMAAAPGGGKLFKQNLSLEGAYPSLRRFLAGLETLPTLTVVKQARLERAGGAGEGRVRANLELATYSQPSSEPGS